MLRWEAGEIAITINKMTTVAREGSSATLRFCDNVITKVGDDTYVKLVPQGSSLVRMICDNNVHAPSPMPKNFSLTSAIGYQTIMRLRNEAQIAELSTPSESKLSKLFGDAELLTPRNRSDLAKNGMKCQMPVNALRR